MGEKLIWEDYHLRGVEYEIWYDYNQWYIACPRCRYVLTGTGGSEDTTQKCGNHFNPPLTAAEIDRINDAVHDWLVDW